MTGSTNADSAAEVTLADALGVVTDAQSYRNILYLVLAFPLGLAYYVVLVTGFALGLGLSVLVVGLGILLGTVVGLRYIAAFERKLANGLLGTSIPEPNDVERDGDGIVATARAYLQAGSTWKGLAFVMLKFWLGILAFVLLVSLLGAGIELALLPLVPEGMFNVQVVNWTVAESFATSSQRLLAVPAGLVLTLVAFHVLNAVADVNASIASSLLGPSDEQSDR
jgi:hypothetical protein